VHPQLDVTSHARLLHFDARPYDLGRPGGGGEHTRQALDAAGLGTWELDPTTGERRVSERCLELLGLVGDESVTSERLERAIHPGDRAHWRMSIARALDPASGGEYRAEYRTNGTPSRWIAATGKAFFRDGRAVRLIGTVQDVTDRKVAEREREIFLGALGHDLRNPLHAIMIHSVLLQRRNGAAVAEPVARIMSSTKRMARMIDDLIDFARSRTGELSLARAPVDLVDVCKDVLYEVMLSSPDRTIDLSHFGDTRGEWDADRLGQVVQNLASNAVAHGAPRSPIEVSVGEVGAAVRITVSNQGAPIPLELREHLFDPFRRGDGVSTPRTGRSAGAGKGAGLGLYVARQIVLAHGGSIDFTSDEAGTVFRVELPRTPSSG
jgi:sigma-B regulation protein RsbU (phosphoserine phosphatase)